MSAKKNNKKTVDPITNKSEFVRSMGDAPAKDIVAAAKVRGVTITPAHVYAIRSKSNASKPKRSAARTQADTATADVVVGSRLEDMIRRIVREEVASFFAPVMRATKVVATA